MVILIFSGLIWKDLDFDGLHGESQNGRVVGKEAAVQDWLPEICQKILHLELWVAKKIAPVEFLDFLSINKKKLSKKFNWIDVKLVGKDLQ